MPSGQLSGGQKKLLELGRVMMLGRRLILLDEPFAGVNAVLIAEIMDRIRELHGRGIGFLIIEHDLEALSDLVDEMHVLDQGVAARVRAAAQRCSPTRACATRISEARAMTAVLSVAGLRGGYTEVDILKGVDLPWSTATSSPSPEPTAPASRRSPRRSSACCRVSRGDIVVDGRSITARAGRAARGSRHRLRAAGRECVRRADDPRKSADRRRGGKQSQPHR